MPLAPGFFADFDSATAMARATARCLKGKDLPALGLGRALKVAAHDGGRV